MDCGSEVNTLTFSHNGRYLATGHQDHSVRLWQLSIADKINVKQVGVRR